MATTEKLGHENVEHLEKAPDTEHTGLDENALPSYDDKETKRILRKCDVRLLPVLVLLYILSFLDRSNIGNANIAGLSETLGLVEHQYNYCLMIFFFPYALLEVPSNMILKLLTPSLWIAILMLCWGTVMTLQGIVQSYHGLLLTRFFLGVTEAGFFPASSYLLTTWYCRFELQRRMAVFYAGAAISGAFSGLLSYGIIQMDGVGGLEGWRWIFILEGIATVAVGTTVKFILPDSPRQASFLEDWEKDFMMERLEQDAGTAAGHVDYDDKFSIKSLTGVLSEWKLWVTIVCCWGNSIIIYAYTYTVPTIVVSLGYENAIAQLVTVPLYVAGVISVLLFAWLADKHHVRWVFVVGPYSIAMVGCIALLAIPAEGYAGVKYFFLFFIPVGAYAGIVSILSWMGNNLAPSWKRAIGMAFVLTGTNLGGLVGSNIFISSQAPAYPLGYGLCLGVLCAAICAAGILAVAYRRINRKREAMSVEEIRAQHSDAELTQMGDKSPLFRYVL
ncbi:hypothetical protein LTR37_015260 [Vermiconidia calcicola]|uniref:Uncharacterized protein n=1 Tax=Vermiconidia calcicola TaxID=1690605 RepID=A0ACC3MU25_9PEZI|nr:hypothetical protein LTR37_015260 [Vermiconidia calcicola]